MPLEFFRKTLNQFFSCEMPHRNIISNFDISFEILIGRNYHVESTLKVLIFNTTADQNSWLAFNHRCLNQWLSTCRGGIIFQTAGSSDCTSKLIGILRVVKIFDFRIKVDFFSKTNKFLISSFKNSVDCFPSSLFAEVFWLQKIQIVAVLSVYLPIFKRPACWEVVVFNSFLISSLIIPVMIDN